MKPNTQVLEVWGGLACFTRPEMKVERFSYPVITPSAARAIFDAIYWKPKFFWQIKKIEILSPLRYITLRRNEVKGKVPSERTVISWMTGKSEPEPLWADGGDEFKGRTQRQTMALKDVRYRLSALIHPYPEFIGELPAMEAQFQRRAKRGQCIYQPYLGCREFPAYFRLIEDQSSASPESINLDLGYMLYDVFDLSRPGDKHEQASISLFHASVQDGVLDVPEYDSPDVLKAGKEKC